MLNLTERIKTYCCIYRTHHYSSAIFTILVTRKSPTAETFHIKTPKAYFSTFISTSNDIEPYFLQKTQITKKMSGHGKKAKPVFGTRKSIYFICIFATGNQ